MAFVIVDGIELTYEQIGVIGHVTRQACELVGTGAIEKLTRSPRAKYLARAYAEQRSKCGRS